MTSSLKGLSTTPNSSPVKFSQHQLKHFHFRGLASALNIGKQGEQDSMRIYNFWLREMYNKTADQKGGSKLPKLSVVDRHNHENILQGIKIKKRKSTIFGSLWNWDCGHAQNRSPYFVRHHVQRSRTSLWPQSRVLKVYDIPPLNDAEQIRSGQWTDGKERRKSSNPLALRVGTSHFWKLPFCKTAI